ncbi:ankyrin [Penicillium canescens]|nr:ankyrin [Penicillium canescens]
MPEEKEGQHLQLSEKLCKAHAPPAQELLQVLLFIVSNNLNLEGPRRYSNLRERDKFIMQVFHVSGLNNVQSVKFLLSQPDATAEAVVEKLLGVQ